MKFTIIKMNGKIKQKERKGRKTKKIHEQQLKMCVSDYT